MALSHSSMFGQRILILIPHPDDEVAGCCAAIGRARTAGATVFGAYLTTGVPAEEVFWTRQRSRHAERVRRRREEAEHCAKRLQIEPVHFGTTASRHLRESLGELREALQTLAQHNRADVLWTPAYEGGHQDHDVTNFLASLLGAQVPVWEFSEYNYAGGRLRSQEFPSRNGTELGLELSAEEQERKRDALQIYASEGRNLTYVRTEREVFRPLAEYDYSRPPHGGKLFYQRFQWVPFRHPRVDYTQPEEVCRAIQEFQAKRAKPDS